MMNLNPKPTLEEMLNPIMEAKTKKEALKHFQAYMDIFIRDGFPPDKAWERAFGNVDWYARYFSQKVFNRVWRYLHDSGK